MSQSTQPTAPNDPSASPAAWKRVVAKYQRPADSRAIWQAANTLVPYAALWYLMHLSLSVSIWLTIPLVILAGGFLVRTFIIFHDCGHGSFFRSARANEVLGFIAGVLCFTPFHQWRWEHSVHHASAGDLDRRGTGDVWTMTVQEYLNASRWKRFSYRLARNPLVLFLIAPMFLFLFLQRLPVPRAGGKERRWVHITNLCMVAVAFGLSWVFGFQDYLLLQLGVVAVASSAGVWLFYVQHQFEDVYWARGNEWDYTQAALQGSSFYKLPKILQWFSGNIGFHHIHHLSPRIPNYHLEKCHKAEPLFHSVKPLTMLESLKCFGYRLFDEQSRRMVGFRAVSKRRRAALGRA